jgi:DNA repair protein RadA/Sms
VAALASSARGRALPAGAVYFGEIGLLGEIRRVPAAASRIKESLALGFSTVVLPSGNAAEAAPFPDLTVVPVERVREFLAGVGAPGAVR